MLSRGGCAHPHGAALLLPASTGVCTFCTSLLALPALYSSLTRLLTNRTNCRADTTAANTQRGVDGCCLLPQLLHGQPGLLVGSPCRAGQEGWAGAAGPQHRSAFRAEQCLCLAQGSRGAEALIHSPERGCRHSECGAGAWPRAATSCASLVFSKTPLGWEAAACGAEGGSHSWLGPWGSMTLLHRRQRGATGKGTTPLLLLSGSFPWLKVTPDHHQIMSLCSSGVLPSLQAWQKKKKKK